MDTTTKMLEELLLFLRPVMLGTFGGIASIFVSGKRPDASAIMSCVFVSGFAGWLGGRLSDAMHLSNDYRDVIIGIGGFLGAIFLTIVAKFVAKKFLGVDISDNICANEKRASIRKEEAPVEDSSDS